MLASEAMGKQIVNTKPIELGMDLYLHVKTKVQVTISAKLHFFSKVIPRCLSLIFGGFVVSLNNEY